MNGFQQQDERKQFKCDICPKSFATKGNLKIHMEIHGSKKPCNWPECGKSFFRLQDLKSHLKSHTEGATFKCNFCEKLFMSIQALNRHIKAHSMEKPYKCDVCDKEHLSVTSLNRHMRIHTEDKIINFNSCETPFTQQHDLLLINEESHTGKKPFSCSICQRSFAGSEHFKRHFTSHTGEKPFSCSICQKGFARRDYLKLHIRSHTGEKPYTCAECGKQFAHRSNMTKHFKMHHTKIQDKMESLSRISEVRHNMNSLNTTTSKFCNRGFKNTKEDKGIHDSYATCKECRLVCRSLKHLCRHYSIRHNFPQVLLKRLL